MQVDETWSAVVELCSELAPVTVRRSRFADKPALFLGRREFVHWEGPGLIDLHLAHPDDVNRLRPLFETAVVANT
jgi:hypothetical protein